MPHLAAVFKGCSCRRLCASPSSQGFFVPTQPFEKKGRAFAFLLVALAAGRGGKTPSAFTALLPCFAKAFAARQTAAFTKPKGRNMKQTTISKALCYTRGLTYLLKVMFSVALYCLKSILSLTLHIIDKSRAVHKVLVILKSCDGLF